MEGVAGNQTPSANSEIIHPTPSPLPPFMHFLHPCVVNFLEESILYIFAVCAE
jgi:hypothetical protein